MPNPYLQPTQQQGGGNFMRDLFTALKPGHRDDRWDIINADRQRDRGMAPDQIALRTKAEEWEREDQKLKLEKADRNREDSALTGSYVDYLKRHKADGKPKDQMLSFKSWQAFDQDDRTDLLTGGGAKDYASRPSVDIQNEIFREKKLKEMKEAGATETQMKDWYKRFDNTVQANKYMKLGDTVVGSSGGRPMESAFKDMTLDQQAEFVAKKEADKQSMIMFKKDVQGVDSDFRHVAQNVVPDLRDMLEETITLENAIRDGKFNATGPFESLWTKYTNEEEAYMNAMSIRRALMNLNLVNLAPVTEQEFETIEKMYANLKLDPKGNLGALKAAREIIERKLGMMQEKNRYWHDNNRSLQGFGLDEYEDWTTPRSGIDAGKGRDPDIEAALKGN